MPKAGEIHNSSGAVFNLIFGPLPDANGFGVNSTNPENGGILQGDTPLVVDFTQPPDLASLGVPTGDDGQPIAGAWSLTGPNQATFTPDADWPVGAVNLDLGGATNATGEPAANPIPPRSFIGQPVTPAPTFVSVSPNDGGDLVGDDPLVLEFTGPIDPSTLPVPNEPGVGPVPGVWLETSPGVYAFTPTDGWPDGPVQVDFNGVLDPDGNPVVIAPDDMTFEGSDGETPVTATSTPGPLSGMDPFTIAPDVPLDVATLPLPTDSTGAEIPGDWVDNGDGTYTFTPTSDWPAATGPATFDFSDTETEDGEMAVMPEIVVATTTSGGTGGGGGGDPLDPAGGGGGGDPFDPAGGGGGDPGDGMFEEVFYSGITPPADANAPLVIEYTGSVSFPPNPVNDATGQPIPGTYSQTTPGIVEFVPDGGWPLGVSISVDTSSVASTNSGLPVNGGAVEIFTVI